MFKVIKDNERYSVIDVRNTHYEGSYQVLEKSEDLPTGRICGIYFNRKDAIDFFNKLTKGN